MAFTIKTEITISASPEKVWTIFSNFKNHSNWNPFILRFEGEVKQGSKILVEIKPPNGKPMIFKPIVKSIITNKELSWKGRFILPGIFDGYHKFEIIDNHNGTTTFIQSEEFKGILVPFAKKQLNENTRNGFILMNQKLKELCEN